MRTIDGGFKRGVGALQASLSMMPTEPGLTRAPVAEDILVLEHAARDEDVRSMARNPAAIERLWDACQVPDYRKIAPATHAEMVVTLYGFLMREGNIPTDWFGQQLAQADRTDGDIDTLSNRIAMLQDLVREIGDSRAGDGHPEPPPPHY